MDCLGATRQNIIRDVKLMIRDAKLKNLVVNTRKASSISSLNSWFNQLNDYPATIRAGEMATEWGLQRTAELEEKGYCTCYPESKFPE